MYKTRSVAKKECDLFNTWPQLGSKWCVIGKYVTYTNIHA